MSTSRRPARSVGAADAPAARVWSTFHDPLWLRLRDYRFLNDVLALAVRHSVRSHFRYVDVVEWLASGTSPLPRAWYITGCSRSRRAISMPHRRILRQSDHVGVSMKATSRFGGRWRARYQAIEQHGHIVMWISAIAGRQRVLCKNSIRWVSCIRSSLWVKWEWTGLSRGTGTQERAIDAHDLLTISQHHGESGTHQCTQSGVTTCLSLDQVHKNGKWWTCGKMVTKKECSSDTLPNFMFWLGYRDSNPNYLIQRRSHTLSADHLVTCT